MKNGMFKLMTFLVLVIGTLGFIPGPLLPFRLGEELAAQSAIFFAIAFFFLTNKWLKLFLVWTLIRHLLQINQLSIYGVYVTVAYLVFYQIIIDKIVKDKVSFILNCICGVALLQVTMMIMQYFGIWWIIAPITASDGKWTTLLFKNTIYSLHYTSTPHLFHYTLTGFTSNMNMGAGLLVMCLPAFFRKRWFWFIPLIILGLYWSRTMGGIIPAAIVIGIYIWVKKIKFRFAVITAILAIIISYILYLESMRQLLAGSGRLEVWEFIIKKMIPLKWITGWGVNVSRSLWPIITKETSFKHILWEHSHNEYITLWLEYGAIGFFIIMGYLWSILKPAICNVVKNHNKFIILLGAIAFLLNSAVSFPLHVTIGIMGIIWFALLEKLNKGEVG